MLTLGALALEPGAAACGAVSLGLAAWGGWLFLVVFGSLVAFTAYLRLIAAWGPARAGSYAYVSPVIAVLLGVLVLGEHLGLRDGARHGVAARCGFLLAAGVCASATFLGPCADRFTAGRPSQVNCLIAIFLSIQRTGRTMTERTRRGGCNCGKVQVDIRGEPIRVGLCHCLTCRKETGTPFMAFAVWDRRQVTVTGQTGSWTATTDYRHFCL